MNYFEKILQNFNSFNLLNEAKFEVKNVSEYNKILNTCKTVNPRQIKQGFFYAYDYDFSLDYPISELIYFDERPLDFIFTKKDSNHVFGLNFHFIPWLNRSLILKNMLAINPLSDTSKPQKMNISYNMLKGISAKNQFCVRQYRTDRINNLKIIPFDKMRELVKYNIESFYAVEFDAIVNRHKKYKVDKIKLK